MDITAGNCFFKFGWSSFSLLLSILIFRQSFREQWEVKLEGALWCDRGSCPSQPDLLFLLDSYCPGPGPAYCSFNCIVHWGAERAVWVISIHQAGTSIQLPSLTSSWPSAQAAMLVLDTNDETTAKSISTTGHCILSAICFYFLVCCLKKNSKVWIIGLEEQRGNHF